MGLFKNISRRLLRDEYRDLTMKAQAFESAMRVAPWRMTGQDLLREMDQQTLDLLRRQLQYQTIISGESTELDRLQVVEMARHYYNNADPLIWRMVSIWTDYGFGQHIQLTCNDEKAQEAIDAFVEAPANRGIMSDRELHKLSDVLLIDGELFFLFYVSAADGAVTLRRIPTEQIKEIHCDPDDEDMQILYQREWTPKAGETSKLFYRDWTASDENVRQVLGALKDAVLAEARNDGATPQYIMHVPFNTLEKRGWPMVGRSIPWSEEYRRFLEARAAVAASVAQFVREAKAVGGGSRAVDAIKSFFASSLQTSSTDWERNPAAAPGSTLATNSAVDMRNYPLTTGAGDAEIDGMTIAAQAGVGMGIPPHLLGRPDAMQNRATAKEVMGPLMRQLERYQVFWSSVFRDIVDFVLIQAEQYGGQHYKDHGCTVTMDSPFDADLNQVMMGLGMLGQLGAITPKVAAKIALAMPDYNVQNLDGTIDEIFPEGGTPPVPFNVTGAPSGVARPVVATPAPQQPEVETPEPSADGITQAEAVAMLEGAARIIAGEGNGYHG